MRCVVRLIAVNQEGVVLPAPRRRSEPLVLGHPGRAEQAPVVARDGRSRWFMVYACTSGDADGDVGVAGDW